MAKQQHSATEASLGAQAHSGQLRPEAFRFPKLRAAATPEHYNLHIAALEWSLDSPITIRGEEDILSKRMWAERFEPFAHQIKNLITFCRRAPVALFADDVGLGKTISAGLVLSELMVRKKVGRALVVAPKLLLPQWQEELAAKFVIPAETATGAQLPAAIRRSVPVVVSTYQSVRANLDDIRNSNFDMLILDEAHKLRNLHGTSQPPQFAVGVRQALADRVFKYVLMLTATPIQNRLWDLYSLVDLLTAAKGHTNPLGSPESFKATYIEDTRAVQIRRGRREEFRQHLSNYIMRTRRNDAKLVFPTRRVRTHRVPASSVETRLLSLVGELMREHSLNGLAQSSIGQALMSSPQALSSQIEEMALRGTVSQDFAHEVRALVASDSASGKLTGLTVLLQELASKRPDDWRVVVFTSRIKTQEAIGKHLESLRIPVGYITGARADQNERAIRSFRQSPPGVRVLISTDAGAEGINLQVANVLVNYDLPWNPMVMEQRIGRIQRLASTHAEVTILNLVLAGSVEEKVVARLGEKLQAIAESLGDIEGILESAAHAGEDEESFEAMIRKLVVDSLRGVDVEEATRRAAASIEEGKQVFEAERETVEKTLGDLRDLHRTGPRVPEITPVTPSVEAKDFVLRALTRDGARIRPIDGDILAVTLPGQNEFKLTFKDKALDFNDNGAFFGGNPARLFVPGKRDFERLAQSWAEKSGSLVVDRSRRSEEEIEQILSDWVGAIGLELNDLKIMDRHEGFQGELICRASVAVAHDRLEKLINLPVASGAFAQIEPATADESPSTSEFDTSRLNDDLQELVRAAIKAEPDLTKFADFYEKRLIEETAAADDLERKRRLREQFSPMAAADAVAARGVRFSLLQVAAQIRIDGEGPYPAEFNILPSATGGRVTPMSEWITCQHSGRMVPIAATDVCTLSGQRVLLHFMARSAASGRMALKEQMVLCQDSGELFLPDETEVCAITNRRVRKDLLTASAVSGRFAISPEFATCEITGEKVLPDELTESAVSGRRFRNDQARVSSLSGRAGHVSEFVASALPEGWLARDEAAQSEVSQLWGDSKQLVRSERPPGRLGLPSETVRSEASGRLVLRDEVQPSAISGRLALPEELESCEFTASRCLPRELETSTVSGRRFRSDEQATSTLSGRTGHSTEFVDSVDPPGMLACDEAERSEVSGKWAQRGRLCASEKPPHRKALRDEMIASAVSGKLILPDEVEHSQISGKPALPEELVQCEFTAVRATPDELIVSDVSAKRFRRDEALTSVLSGRCGHSTEFVRSVAPSGWLAKDEASQSALSGEWGAKSMLIASARPPHRVGLAHELVTCELTGQRLLRDEVAPSSLSGRIIDDSLLVASAASGKRAIAEEMVVCEATGKRLLPAETSICSITGKRVDLRELARSEVSGIAGLSSRLVRCVETGKLALPSEAVQCTLTGGPVLSSETEQCVITGRRSNRRFGQRCPSTRKFFIDDQVSRQRMMDLHGTPSILGVCQWTARTMLSNHLGKCALTGLEVDREQLNREGELVVLRQLLDGQAVDGSQPLGSKALEWIRSAHPILRSAQDGVICQSAGRQTFVGAIRVRSGLLGFGSAYCAVAFSGETPLSLKCAPVFGRRSARGWTRQLP